jgi:hypothetical protein
MSYGCCRRAWVATGDRATCYSISTSRLSSSTRARPLAAKLATELALDGGGALEAPSSRRSSIDGGGSTAAACALGPPPPPRAHRR